MDRANYWNTRASSGKSANASKLAQLFLSTPLIRLMMCLLLFAMALSPLANIGKAESTESCVDEVIQPTLVTAVHVQPESGFAPVLDEINHAQCSIDLSMYLFTAEEIVDALNYAVQRGIHVRVILEQDPFGTYGTQQDIFDELTGIGAEVHWASSDFAYSHAKYMIVDSSVLIATNQNFTNAGFMSNREFGVVTTHPGHVNEAVQVFESDWSGSPSPTSFQYLVVSPINARDRILALINGSRESIWMYAEVLRDKEITAALDDAVTRGVDVRLLVNPSASDEDAPYFLDALDHGVQIRILRSPYVHSKALIVDGNQALIGSQNYSDTSLDLNREVGIVMTDEVSLDIMMVTFEGDWLRGEPIDTVSMMGVDTPFRLTRPVRVGRITFGRWGVV